MLLYNSGLDFVFVFLDVLLPRNALCGFLPTPRPFMCHITNQSFPLRSKFSNLRPFLYPPVSRHSPRTIKYSCECYYFSTIYKSGWKNQLPMDDFRHVMLPTILFFSLGRTRRAVGAIQRWISGTWSLSLKICQKKTKKNPSQCLCLMSP